MIYRDANSVLYARENSPIAPIADIPADKGGVAARLYFP
jgi:hypothetical protein